MDIQISETDALSLVEVTKMTGIGVKQNCPAENRFIHLDNLGSKYTKLTGGPRQWIWSYAWMMCVFLVDVCVCVCTFRG